MGPSGPNEERTAKPSLWRSGLAVKLAACLVLSTALLSALAGYTILRLQRRHSEQIILSSAERITDIIERSARYQMMLNDRAALYHLIQDFGSEPGIRRVRILNEEGRIQYSTSAGEVGSMVDKSAEACYGCHAQAAPLTKLARRDRARIFLERSADRTLGVIRAIENQPACSNAACHAHPASRQILGVIDAQLSLAEVDRQVAEQQKQLLYGAITALLLLCGFSVLFVWRFVHQPIRQLIFGTHKVAEGDLNYKLPVETRDELGELAESFNRMTGDLANARAELTDWATTLEQRVQQKSAQLEQAHTTLVASEKMASLGKLAATVAHEVNNPLFGMLTYARLALKSLNKGPLDDKSRATMAEHLGVIERESKRCGEIMRNLLTFARQSAPHRELTDLNTLVERALKLVQHQLDLLQIALAKNLGENLPQVECDPGQIQQVLLVLMVNATEAMAQGGRLAVSTECDQQGRAIAIRVADTGGGIPGEALAQIFEPFFTTKENQHRTGLGLAIAKNITEQHGGSLRVESTSSQGTVFCVRVPLGSNGAKA